MLERYQRYLFHYRKKNGEPLSFHSQHSRLRAVRVWFKWLARQNYHAAQSGQRTRATAPGLPAAQAVLTIAEAEQVLAAARYHTIRWDCAIAPSWKRSTRPGCGGWS